MRVNFIKILGASLLVAQGIAITSFAQSEKQVMNLVDLNEMPTISGLEISPNGKYVLFNQSTINWEEDKRDSHLWRANVDGSGITQMTNGNKGEDAATWSPDGSKIAFLAKRGKDKKAQIYVMHNMGGEAKRLSDHATDIASYEWAPDGKSIVFLADDDMEPIKKARKKNKDDMIRFDERAQRHLWRLDVETSEENALTSGNFSIRFFNISYDGTKILHNRAPSSLLDDLPNSDLWVMEINGNDPRSITSNNIVLESNPFFSEDGKTVYFTSDSSADGQDYYYNNKLFSISVDGQNLKVLTWDEDFSLGGTMLSKSGKSIYLWVQEGVYNKLYNYEIATGDILPLSRTTDNISAWDYDERADIHIAALGNAQTPGDIWTLASGKGDRQLTHIFDYMAEDFLLPKVEVVSWEGEDGVMVEGILTYPVGYEEGQQYPLIVQTHGGPASADTVGRLFGSYSYQTKAAGEGYAVLKPNYRGSTGYGDAFMRDMVGSYFNQSHLDVMKGVDAMIELGIADPERMIKMGWSAGGHMTNKIITHTNRFKAASSGAGAVNWIGMYAQSDIRVYRTPWFGATPWVKDAPIDVYWENSPLKDIHKVTTPTLVLVGEKDPRVPPEQSTELYRALKFNGVTTEYFQAPGEPHGWRKPSHRMFKGNVELGWFSKHALGENYEWEKVPGSGEEKVEKEEEKNEIS